MSADRLLKRKGRVSPEVATERKRIVAWIDRLVDAACDRHDAAGPHEKGATGAAAADLAHLAAVVRGDDGADERLEKRLTAFAEPSAAE